MANKIQMKNPLVFIGKAGTFGQAFDKIGSSRNIEDIVLGRLDLDINHERNIIEFLDAHNPWAVINAAG